MILIGQYDSSFVRRVGIALTLYRLPFEHRPWSIMADADKIRPLNPLTRVPALVLDDGTVLTESHLIIDYIDSLAPPDLLLCPRSEPERHRILRICGIAMGMVDKVVALFYDPRLHDQTSPLWVERCQGQITAAAALLEQERAARPGPFWFGRMTHADIAVTVALRHFADSHPGLVDMDAHPALAAHASRCEAMPVFQTIQQPFIPPA